MIPALTVQVPMTTATRVTPAVMIAVTIAATTVVMMMNLATLIFRTLSISVSCPNPHPGPSLLMCLQISCESSFKLDSIQSGGTIATIVETSSDLPIGRFMLTNAQLTSLLQMCSVLASNDIISSGIENTASLISASNWETRAS